MVRCKKLLPVSLHELLVKNAGPREVKEHEGRLPNHDHHHHNHHHHHHHHQSLRNVRSPHHIDRHAPTPCLKDDDERNIEIRTVGGRTVSLAKMAYSKVIFYLREDSRSGFFLKPSP